MAFGITLSFGLFALSLISFMVFLSFGGGSAAPLDIEDTETSHSATDTENKYQDKENNRDNTKRSMDSFF